MCPPAPCGVDRLPIPPLVAIHVHHGLSVEADAWAAFCEQQCLTRGVALKVERVQLTPGACIEEAARSARYQAFAQHLPAGARHPLQTRDEYCDA